ncbi:hypothetical protein AB0K60_35675 [Thermopolyspora sp. NPDC052614]|uniref:hypothetical protein n=1 Tax=Thermopolyspora sp. NPDC052614 TaxID=3155682 RepID=UPI0034126D9B
MGGMIRHAHLVTPAVAGAIARAALTGALLAALADLADLAAPTALAASPLDGAER